MLNRRQNRRAVVAMLGAGAASAALRPIGAGATFEGQEHEESSATPGTPVASAEGSLTIYSGQHESAVQALADAFTAETGITIEIRSGSESDLANQIIEEGDNTNADVFLTENPEPAAMLDTRDLLEPIAGEALAKTDSRFNPENGHWLGFVARSRAVFFNTELIDESELPASILDLADDRWAGTYAYASGDGFISTVNYLVNTIGEDDTRSWLQGIAQTGENLLKNGAVRDAVEAGQYSFGLSNHYYWYILAKQEGGPENLTSRVHYMKNGDAGALILASAAAIPAASQHRELAQQFVSWLADAEGGQAILAEVTPQYPLAEGVESSFGLPPLSELEPPEFDQSSLNDIEKATELVLEAGII